MSPPTTADSPPPGRRSRWQIDVRTLLVLVLCCGSLFLAARTIWFNTQPTQSAARAIRSGLPESRRQAARELEIVPPGDVPLAVEALIGAMKDGDAGVRAQASSSLGTITGSVLRMGTNPEAVRAGVRALIAATKDPQLEIRYAAVSALRAILSTRPSGSVVVIAPGTATLTPPPPRPTASPLADTLDLDALAAALVEATRDREGDVDKVAFLALGFLGEHTGGAPPPALLEAFDDPTETIQVLAIQSLGHYQTGTDTAIPHLIRALGRPDTSSLFTAAFVTFDQIHPSREAVPVLVKALSDPSAMVRARVARALGKMGPKAVAAVPALLLLLREATGPLPSSEPPNPANPSRINDAPHQAAWALGLIAPDSDRATEVVAALMELLKSSAQSDRYAASEALSHFGAAAAPALPTMIAHLRQIADTPGYNAYGTGLAEFLGQIAPGTPMADEAAAALVESLRSESEFTREAALKGLPRLREIGAPLLPRLREIASDKRPAIRSAADRAIEIFQPKPAETEPDETPE